MEGNLRLVLMLVVCLGSVPAWTKSTLEERCPHECTCEYTTYGSSNKERLVVDCQDQELEEIPDFAALQKLSIYRIYLNQNKLSRVPDGIFAKLNVEGIELADNFNLGEFTRASFQGLERSLRYLSLKRTSVELSEASFLHHLPELRILDLADIRTDSFESITNGTFHKLGKLEELDLSNNYIGEIADSAFVGMDKLTILKLDQNEDLTDVPTAVRRATNLQELSLVANSISDLTEDSLSGLHNLKTLLLSKNKLKNATIHPQAFKDCAQSLTHLKLDSNKLGAVPDHVFKHLTNLKVLHLNATRLKGIKPKIFTYLTQLEELDLSNNKLSTSFKRNLFLGLGSSLKTLALKNVGISNVPTLSLFILQNLTTLDLTSNSIKKLTKDSFRGLHLHKLSIMYNTLEEIDADTFESFKVPIELILNKNFLVDVSFLEDACRFSHVELQDNSVQCTCKLHGFTYGELDKFTLDGECTTPVEYVGASLKDYVTQSSEECQAMNVTYVDENEHCWWHGSTDGATGLQGSWTLLLSLILYTVRIISV